MLQDDVSENFPVLAVWSGLVLFRPTVINGMVNYSVGKEPLFTWKSSLPIPKFQVKERNKIRPQPQHHHHQQPNTILPKHNTIHLSSSNSFRMPFLPLIKAGDSLPALKIMLWDSTKVAEPTEGPVYFEVASSFLLEDLLAFPFPLLLDITFSTHDETPPIDQIKRTCARPFEVIAALSPTLYHQYPNVDSSSSTFLIEKPSPTAQSRALPPSCLSPSKDPTSGPHLR
jgi:hypothetical protein